MLEHDDGDGDNCDGHDDGDGDDGDVMTVIMVMVMRTKVHGKNSFSYFMKI